MIWRYLLFLQPQGHAALLRRHYSQSGASLHHHFRILLLQHHHPAMNKAAANLWVKRVTPFNRHLNIHRKHPKPLLTRTFLLTSFGQHPTHKMFVLPHVVTSESKNYHPTIPLLIQLIRFMLTNCTKMKTYIICLSCCNGHVIVSTGYKRQNKQTDENVADGPNNKIITIIIIITTK